MAPFHHTIRASCVGARAATRHIKLGTGVVSLPYHRPMIVGRTSRAARQSDPRAGVVRRRSWRTGHRCAHVRRRADAHASDDGRVARRDLATVHRDRADHRRVGLVHAARRGAAGTPEHAAAHADRRGVEAVAVGTRAGRQVRGRLVVGRTSCRATRARWPASRRRISSAWPNVARRSRRCARRSTKPSSRVSVRMSVLEHQGRGMATWQ